MATVIISYPASYLREGGSGGHPGGGGSRAGGAQADTKGGGDIRGAVVQADSEAKVKYP